jgi:hypothetical protein
MEVGCFNSSAEAPVAHSPTNEPSLKVAPGQGSGFILAGLAILAAGAIWPGTPCVMAMALVALGATIATLARVQNSPALVPAILFHLAVYSGLYALFVAATLHAAVASPHHGCTAATILDLTLSVLPITAMLRQACGVFSAGAPTA